MILNNLTGFYNIKNNLFTIDSTGRFLKKKWIINNYQQTILKEKSLLMIRINNNKNLITKIIKNAKQFLTHKGKMIEIVLFFKIFSNFYEKSLLLEGGKIAKKFAIIRIIFFQKKIIQKLIGINREIFCSYIKNQTKTISHLKINGKIFIFEKKLKKIKSILFCEKEDDKNKLIESLKQRINCPIKYNLEKNVVLTKCGHSFSSACIKDLIQKRNRKCPLCGQRFGLDNIKTLFLV
ncbi:hypothetical protein T484DRAFT_1662256 [Baffinella frigidus]|nr:hypothetical protein T484DRAFT_1662256 [Cryptophyta sp. CCMP2293]